MTRRLAAILAADVVGYSRLVSVDETDALARLGTLRREVIEPTIAKHSGRLFKVMGDGFLMEFASAVQAVTCAIAIQTEVEKVASEVDDTRRMRLRIGIHIGDVMVEGDDLMGDGVNIAARLESIAAVGGVSISRAVHDQVRDRIDVAFDDKGEVALKNITRPVQVFALAGPKPPTSTLTEPAPPLALPDKPSIAVLPFQNMSGDPEQEYFADGMVEDIITALSRFKSLFVIARNSSFTYKGKAVDVKQVGRELGVRYVLEGSVRKAGSRVRITGQLIDTDTGAHLWADRFDGSLEDVFALQDQVTTSVVGAIAPAVDRAEVERGTRKPTENLQAYDCFLRGLAHSYGSTRESLEKALAFFHQAIELDAGLSSAYGMAAWCYGWKKIQGWIVDKGREEEETRRLALQVATIGQDDALALSRAGWALFYVCGDFETGAVLIDQGLSANQNLAAAWRSRAILSLFNGEHENATDYVNRAIRLSPLDPLNFSSESILAAAQLFLGKYDDALKQAAKSLARHPTYMLALRTLVVANALAGNLEKARHALARLREVYPTLCLSELKLWLPYRRPEDVERMAEGFRLAGLPE